jgi:uncharacterized surface protein with fasciclin (FAS1) repeats
MKIISKTLRLLPVFLLVLGLTGCSDDDDGGNREFVCDISAGTITANESTVPLSGGTAELSGTLNGDIVLPAFFDVTYVLTTGDNLVIVDAAPTPNFEVTEVGNYTIHTLVAETSDPNDPNFLDLSVINFGTTTGGDVLNLIQTAGICADLDVAGAPVEVTFTIVDLAIDSGLDSLVAAVLAADGDLATVLSGDGPFTVLAPTNQAFEDFLNGTPLEDVDPAVLQQILLNHVLVGEVRAADLVGLSDAQGRGYASTSAAGAGGQNLSLLFDTSGMLPRFNNTASVVSADLADVEAQNGVVHVIDAVLGLPTIVDHAVNNDNFTSLTGALTSEGLVENLQGDGPFTVFAPTNDAFAAFTNPNGNALAEILLNHVVSGTTFAADLVNAGAGYTNTLANGPMDLNMNVPKLSLYFNTTNGVVLNGGPEVVATDIVGTNGVIHVVDNVIDIPTVVTFAVADPSFSTLVDALTTLTPNTDFVSILSTPNGTSPAPFTVFAPTNDAFAALPAIPAEADLVPILQHHVSAGINAVSGDLTPNGVTPIPTLQGDDINITLPGSGSNIADVEDGAGNTDIGIIAVDVQAGNGVIHVINKVMLPSAN